MAQSNAYYDLKVCSFTKPDFWKSMNRLKVSRDPEVKSKLKYFFKTIVNNLKMYHRCLRYPCRMSVNYFKTILWKVLPIEIFGTKRNFVQFFNNVIKKICTATYFENIPHKALLKGWRMSDVKWLQNSKLNKEAVVIEMIVWLADTFKTKILKRLFYVQKSLKSNKINFFPINDYRRLHAKSINQMIKNKQLLPANTVSLKVPCKSKLFIFPKAYMTSHRPIVRTQLLGYLNHKHVTSFLKNKGAIFNRNLFSAWSNFVIATKDQPIYGIKLDLKDAFSNVKLEQLKPLLRKFLKNAPTSRNAILNSLENQKIQVNKNQYFRWNRGLMQGMRLSSKLCDLSRSFFDKIYLQEFINKNNFFFRTTDDYFFASCNKDEVLKFKSIIIEHSQITEEKTQSNLDGNERIIFNGRIFNLTTKEIEIFINTDVQTYRFKSKLYYDKNEKNVYNYLKEIGGLKINCFNFDKLLINANFNSKNTILQNFFKALLIVAFKVECAIMERVRNIPEDLDQVILKLVNYYVEFTRNRLTKTKINKTVPVHVSRKMLKVIGVKAFILVFQKRYLSYKNTIISLKSYIKKDSAFLKKFSKLPTEFNNIKLTRVCSQYK